MRWEGKWKFNNAMHHRHGEVGTEIVSAETESEAREKIKTQVSRDLFNTTMMHRYVDVWSLRVMPY